MMRTKMSQKGDTIVEVLVAIAVVSAMLASSFAVVHKTTQNSRQTEEHDVALKLLEAQVEQLKAASADAVNTPEIFNRALPKKKAFCINGGAVQQINADALPTAYGSYPAGCQSTDGIVYYFGIVETAPNIFTATATWDGARGGVDKVQIAYKVYAP